MFLPPWMGQLQGFSVSPSHCCCCRGLRWQGEAVQCPKRAMLCDLCRTHRRGAGPLFHATRPGSAATMPSFRCWYLLICFFCSVMISNYASSESVWNPCEPQNSQGDQLFSSLQRLKGQPSMRARSARQRRAERQC